MIIERKANKILIALVGTSFELYSGSRAGLSETCQLIGRSLGLLPYFAVMSTLCGRYNGLK